MKFEIHPVDAKTPEKQGEVYFNIVSENGNVLATSEGYKNKLDCKETISSIASSIARHDYAIDDKTEKARSGGSH